MLKKTLKQQQLYADCGDNVSKWGEILTGRWKYDRLVMGCQTSSAVLHKAMEICFHGLKGVIVYCDDLLIYSKSLEEHFIYLKHCMDNNINN